MKITIRTVAEHAGVSIPTVSRVLNSPELVNPKTRTRVLEAVKLLDYYPNGHARGLRLNRPTNIGVLVPKLDDLFFSRLYRGIYDAALELGMAVILHDAQADQNRISDGFTILKRQHSDGIIFCSEPQPQNYATVIARIGIPVVLTLTESGQSDLPAFKVDDERASFDAVAHLAERGHRSIGMIAGPLADPVAGAARFRGYQLALRHYDLPVSDERVAYGNFRYEHGYSAMAELLAHRAATDITAVFAASDEMAIGAMRCIHDNGLRVPDDISIIGFDDIVVANMVTPKLTTIAQPFEVIGKLAVESLVAAIAAGSGSAIDTHYIAHSLVARESVRSIPYDTS
ncbi:MAG: LacI family DNA-binding transcriptional regulator [Bacilli bacterium]